MSETSVTTDPAGARERNLAAVQRVFAAVAAGDADAQVANYTDDVVLEFPFLDPPSRIEGRDTVHAYLKGALGTFSLALTISEVHQSTDPDTMVVEFTSAGTATPTGKPYANSYVAVFRFREGLVCGQKEYFNPVPATLALS